MDDEVEWESVYNFPNYKISSHGEFVDDDGNRVETYLQAGVPFVRLDRFHTYYQGPVWRLMLYSFFDGKLDDVEFSYAWGDVTDLNLDTMVPQYMGADGLWRPIRARRNIRGRRILDRRMGKTSKRVRVIETKEEFDSVFDVSTRYQIDRSNIYSMLRGRLMSAGGYTFEWIDD